MFNKNNAKVMRKNLYHLDLGNCEIELIELKSSSKHLYVVKIIEKVSCLSEDDEVKITEYQNSTFRAAVNRFEIETCRYTENAIYNAAKNKTN